MCLEVKIWCFTTHYVDKVGKRTQRRGYIWKVVRRERRRQAGIRVVHKGGFTERYTTDKVV